MFNAEETKEFILLANEQMADLKLADEILLSFLNNSEFENVLRYMLCNMRKRTKKTYVLVSQGVEVMRTKNRADAHIQMKKANDDWYKYAQRCIDNGETYADNEITLFVEEDE